MTVGYLVLQCIFCCISAACMLPGKRLAAAADITNICRVDSTSIMAVTDESLKGHTVLQVFDTHVACTMTSKLTSFFAHDHHIMLDGP